MKILIVDDHPLVRKGLASVLSLEKDFREILEVASKKEALDVLQNHSPSLAIVDLYLASEDGLEIVFKSRERGCQTRFLILTSSTKKEDYIRAMEADVEGYILKEAFAEDILYAIRLILRGKRFIDSEIIHYGLQNQLTNDSLRELTPRERDVLVELGKGLSNLEIAEELYITENTVKKHVSNIFSKLGLSHRTQAALLVNKSVELI